MNTLPLDALARLNRDARTGVLVFRDVIYALKYRAIREAIIGGAARVERTVVEGRCNSRWHDHYGDDDCDECGGTGKVGLGFAVVTVGDVRWHVPNHVEPGKSWAAGAPLVDAGTWKPGEREEKRAPLEVLADLVAAEKALGVDGDYDLELGVLGEVKHDHGTVNVSWPCSYRIGRLKWGLKACYECAPKVAVNPMATHPVVAEWVALHPGCLDYVPPPPPARWHSRRWW